MKKPVFMPENCRQCRFLQLGHARDDAGYCRRYPPVFVGHHEEENGLIIEIFQQPVVAVEEWCGEFRAVSQ